MPVPLSGPLGSLADQRRADILRIAREEGIARVAVVGSAARGDDRDDSDLDILVVLEPERSLLDLIGFEDRVSALLGARVDAMTRTMLKPRVLTAIEDEAVPL